VADEIVVTLLEDVGRAQQAWLDGLLADEGADQPAGHVTIAGPFGLPAGRMTDEMRRGQAAMNANFQLLVLVSGLALSWYALVAADHRLRALSPELSNPEHGP
jgi:hypothetical protein